MARQTQRRYLFPLILVLLLVVCPTAFAVDGGCGSSPACCAGHGTQDTLSGHFGEAHCAGMPPVAAHVPSSLCQPVHGVEADEAIASVPEEPAVRHAIDGRAEAFTRLSPAATMAVVMTRGRGAGAVGRCAGLVLLRI